MADVIPPIAVSSDPTIWAVPSTSGNTQYVTVLNWGYQDGQNASVVVKPQVGQLRWNANRPIYDLRAHKRLSAAEAATVDLTKDGFVLYALPATEVTTPSVSTALGADGFYYARPRMVSGGQELTGIPVQLTITGHGESVSLYSATGMTTKLPVREGEGAGAYTVTGSELLSGLSATSAFTVVAKAQTPIQPDMPNAAIKAFVGRKDRPLVIALTEKQAGDAAMVKLADDLATRFRVAGRIVRVGKAIPDDVVHSLQVVRAIQRYPQWQTVPADVVLLGPVSGNLLLYDQWRGGLLPAGADAVKVGASLISVSYSPFVGEYQALNLIAVDPSGLRQAVAQVIRAMR
jgi:hypothetical protein